MKESEGFEGKLLNVKLLETLVKLARSVALAPAGVLKIPSKIHKP